MRTSQKSSELAPIHEARARTLLDKVKAPTSTLLYNLCCEASDFSRIVMSSHHLSAQDLIDDIVDFCRSRADKNLSSWHLSVERQVRNCPVEKRNQMVITLGWVKDRVERGEPLMIVSKVHLTILSSSLPLMILNRAAHEPRTQCQPCV